MIETTITFVTIRYDECSEQIYFDRFLPTLQQRNASRHRVSMDLIWDACDEYWKYVDLEIKAGIKDDTHHKRFRGELKKRGNTICSMILSEEMKGWLWGGAEISSVLNLFTSLHFIPWESLYVGDFIRGSFLGQLCTIVRWEDTAKETKVFSNRRAVGEPRTMKRVIFVDGQLDTDPRHNVEGKTIAEYFRALGESVELPNNKEDMFNIARNIGLVHWICEYDPEQKGLRIGKGEFFGIDDAAVYTFDSNGVVVLSACSAGRSFRDCDSIAASIQRESECAVVACSCLVASTIACMFVKEINQSHNTAGAETTFFDIWKDMYAEEPCNKGRRSQRSGSHGYASFVCMDIWGCKQDGTVK